MHASIRSIIQSVAALAIVTHAAASTYIVDDDGGPGVDFVAIQDAIDAAQTGDTLLVMPGQYTGFLLTKALRIFGQGPGHVMFQGLIDIHGIPNGRTAMLADLRSSWYSHPSITIRDCTGTVACETLQAVYGVRVQSCADVRLHKLATEGALPLWITSSRVELVDSNLVGERGSDLICQQFGQAGEGSPAIEILSGELHVARCTIHGGAGGDSTCWDLGYCGADGGDGGPGLLIGGAASVLVSGLSTHEIRGGYGGSGGLLSDCGYPGVAGPGVRMAAGALLRTSGVNIVGIDNQGGAVEFALPDDPTLNLLGTPHPGTNLTLQTAAPVGSNVRLRIGRGPALLLIPGLEEDILTTSLRTFDLGTVPANGLVGFNLPISSAIPKGTAFFAQAWTTLSDGAVHWTNSVPILVR